MLPPVPLELVTLSEETLNISGTGLSKGRLVRPFLLLAQEDRGFESLVRLPAFELHRASVPHSEWRPMRELLPVPASRIGLRPRVGSRR